MPDPAPEPCESADRPARWRVLLWIALLGPLAWLLQFACSFDPELTERVYARGVFPKIRAALTVMSSWSPIALGETLLLIAIGWAMVRVGRGLAAWRRRTRTLRNLAAHALSKSLAIAGALFLLFQLLWGLNHARLPFATQIGLRPEPVAVGKLREVVRLLGVRAEAARPPGLDPMRGLRGYDFRREVGDAYAQAGNSVAALRGPRPVIRIPWISPWLTFSSITGIYSPFTGEANVNGDVPAVILPFTACHEVAHQRGYAREDEANFIAWWVGTRSDDPLLVYSCELSAWRIAMGQLAGADFGAYIKERSAAPKVLQDDDRAIRNFWNSRPQTVTKVLSGITTATNDLYLRSSGHDDGVQSYGRMVDLLIAALVD